MACVVAVSLLGCADQPTTTGGDNLVGIRPAKPSIDNPTGEETPANPKIFEGMQSKVEYRFHNVGGDVFAESITTETPIPGVCDSDPCEVIAIHYVNTDHNGLENVDMISSEGQQICKLQLNQGEIVSSDCSWYR